MPDWSYHTLFRPLLFSLPDEKSRNLTFNVMRGLYRAPLGKQIIKIMGHMSPPTMLEKQLFGISFSSPVGLTGEIDHRLIGTEPLSLFGVGYLDLGVVTLEKRPGTIQKHLETKTISLSDAWMNEGIDYIEKRLASFKHLSTPKAIRLGFDLVKGIQEATQERIQLIERLKDGIDFFIIDTCRQAPWSDEQWREHLDPLVEKCKMWGVPILIGVSVFDSYYKERLLDPEWLVGIDGIVITDIQKKDFFEISNESSQLLVVEYIHKLKDKVALPIITSGGIHEPQDAIKLVEAGAVLVQVNAGLVFSGPGLVKRINEAVLHQEMQKEEHSEIPSTRWSILGWTSGLLLGICLIVIGIISWDVATHQVILPYDETLSGLTRNEIQAINPRILSFMSHDRITLAGTLISVGILYFFISLFGLRNGHHWAKMIMITSCIMGFGNLFYFLGHGYLDPLHTFLTICLFPLFLLLVYFTDVSYKAKNAINLRNTRKWQLSLWGQLSFVCLGFALSLGGVIISIIGMTQIFVPEDLHFLQTTTEHLAYHSPQLLPLMAHDRAGFGGALLANGSALLLLSLWGFRQGERWIWWTFFLAGPPGFIAGIGIHFHIGYIDWVHLTPPLIALFLYLVGVICSFPYLFAKEYGSNARKLLK